MTLVKSHNCTKCGGTLIVHNDRQQYASAKEKYDFILKKDPHNFQALRGRILCAATWENLQNPLQNIEYYMRKAHIPKMIMRIDEALAACSSGKRIRKTLLTD